MSNSNAISKEKPNYFLYIKSLFIGLLISLGLVLIFALLIKAFNIPDGAILPVNISIKIISIFFSALILIKDNRHGLIKGATLGALYIILSFLLFSALSKDFSISIKFLYDLAFGVLSGAIIGFIISNIRK